MTPEPLSDTPASSEGVPPADGRAALPLLHSLLDDLPFALMIYHADGWVVAFNTRAEAFWGVSRTWMITQFNVLTDPQSVALGVRELFARVQGGEVIETEPLLYDTTQSLTDRDRDQQVWYHSTLFPIITDGAISHIGIIYRDVTAQVLQRAAIDQAQAQIAGQHALIHTLASPVVQLWEGILLLSLVGTIDSHRAEVIAEHLLTAIVTTSADVVIMDITGVPIIDVAIANHLVTLAQAVRLLGGRVVLVGIRSEVAQTLVQLGADVSGVKTLANLQSAVAWALKQHGLRVTSA